MVLKCLGSSSYGNCYLLENDKECLIIEAGISLKEVKKALDFDLSKVVGVIVSHEHGDHAKYIKEYAKAGLEVYMSLGTAENVDADFIKINILKPGYWYQLGEFNITSFRVEHDAAEPYGFIIRHPEMGTLLFASDTEYIKYNFSSLNLNHIVVECNYSQKIIDNRVSTGNTVKSLRDRILLSHMELETCKEFVKVNKTSCLYNVVLIHLSDANSDENMFKKEAQNVVGPGVKVFVADKDKEININILPF